MAQMKQYYDGHLINFSGSHGYPTVFVNGKNVLLHRYVWEKHNGKIPKGMNVHHIDENKLNFSIKNLKLLSQKEHKRHHALKNELGKSNKNKPKLHVSGFCGKARRIMAIKNDLTIHFNSVSEAAKFLNTRVGSIGRVLTGKRKFNHGWKFAYV